MGNSRDKRDRDFDANGTRIYNPAHPTVGPDVVRLDDIATGAGLVKASGTADATHGATFSPAVAGSDFSKPLAFEGANVITGAPGSSDLVVHADTVANLAALGALVVGTGSAKVHHGARVRVQSLRRDYVLDYTSTTTADGMNVVTAQGGTGRWIAQIALDAYWVAQTTWFVDPASAVATSNDENNGTTSGAPLKTWGELCRRLIGASLTKTVTITLQSDLPSSDPMLFSFGATSTLAPSTTYLVVRGRKTSVFSGAITDYIQRNPATNTLTQMQISSIPASWTASSLIGKLIEWTDGAGNFIQAWPHTDAGSKYAKISIPHSGDFTASAPPIVAEAQFSIGQTVNVYSFPSVGAIAWWAGPVGQVYFVDLAIPQQMVFRGEASGWFGRISCAALTPYNASVFTYCCSFGQLISINSQVLSKATLSGTLFTNHIYRSTWYLDKCTVQTIQCDHTSAGGDFSSVQAPTDLEHFLKPGDADGGSQTLFNFTGACNSVSCGAAVYGDPCANLASFGEYADNVVAFHVTPTIASSVWPFGTAIMSLNKVQGANNAFRPSPASDLTMSSFRDDVGNRVILTSGTSPALETVTQAINARADTVLGAPHLIVRQLSSGQYDAYAKADTAANASGELAVVIGSQQVAGTNTWLLAGIAGRLLVQFDGTPIVGATAYLSPTTAGNATTTAPTVSGTNQFRPLGIVVAVSGTLGEIEWDPAPGPIPVFDTTLTYTSSKYDAWGRAIPQGTSAGITTAYQTLQNNGTPLAQQTIANFSTSFALTNNVGASRTDVALAAIGPGAGSYGGAGNAIKVLGINAFGQVTSITAGSLYEFIDNAGVALTQRSHLNVLAPLIASDNVTFTRTDITLATAGPGAGTYGGGGNVIASETLDAYGRITAVTTVALPAQGYTTIKNSAGTAMTARLNLKFTSAFAVSDVAPDTVVDRATAGPGAGTYGGVGLAVQSVGLNAYGDVTSVATTTLYYQTVQDSTGTPVTQAAALKASASFTVSTAAGVTTLGLANVGPGTGGYGGLSSAITFVNLNAFGQITSIGSSSVYQFVDNNGVALTQRNQLNVLSPLVANDNAGTARTDLSLSTAGPGAGAYGGSGQLVQALTLDAYGRITALTIAGAATPGYTTIKNSAGTSLTARSNLKFSAAFNPTDVTPDTLIDLTATGPGAGAYGSAGNALQSVTLNAYGQVTAVVTVGVANSLATYWVSSSTSAPANAKNLGALSTGVVWMDVAAGVATPRRAVPGTDYQAAITAASGSVLFVSGGVVTGDPTSFYYDPSQLGIVAYSYDFTQRALAYVGTPPRGINITGGAHTNLPTAELTDVKINLARTVNLVAGNIATMRAMLITPPTYAFAAGSTITTSATLAISGAPTATGGPSTITNPLALWVQAGAAQFDGGVRASSLTALGSLVGLSVAQATSNVTTGGTGKGIAGAFTFAPASGTAAFHGLELGITVNQTGGANGIVRAIFVDTAPISVGGTFRLIELQNNGVPRFYVDAATGNIATTIPSGLVKSVGGTLATATAGVDYQSWTFASPGFSIAGTIVSNDAFTGYAGSPAWNGSTLAGGSLTINASTNASQGQMTLQAGGGGLSYSFALSQANPMAGTAGTQRAIWAVSSFAPTSGTATFRAAAFEYTVNQTGGASGVVEGISIRPTLTSVPTGTGGTQASHLPIRYAPGGIPKWQLYGHGATWMAQADVLLGVGDQGMSANGRPRFYNSASGNNATMATTDPIFVFKFSGAFVFGYSATFSEQSFGDEGMNGSVTPGKTQIGLSSSSDTWASHGSSYVQRQEYVLDLTPQTMKTLKLRSLVINVIAGWGSGSTGDVVWSIYKVSAGASTATVTEVARTSTFAAVALPWTNTGSTINQDSQNISSATAWAHGDRIMLTCRNTGGFTVGGGSANLLTFTAVARFDMAED